MSDDSVPPGGDIRLAPNYRDGCVWVTLPQGRACISPSKARQMADEMEERFDLEAADAEGYEMTAMAERLRELADRVETDD